jgi:beta-N-acetylhexosaminidase
MLQLSDLDPADRVGQLLWIGFEGTAPSSAMERLVRKIRPGGIILFGRNIVSAPQIRSLNDALFRMLRVPPFIALDQEGGRVNRLRPILGPTPSSYALASLPAPGRAVERHAMATALALKSLGFNVNFAPVLDLSGPDPDNGIGDRAYGTDPGRVADLAARFVRVHMRAGVVPIGKHFPGLGAARDDTHQTLPMIRTTRDRLWRRDLLPYRRLRKQLPGVMVGHAYYPGLQGRRAAPASLSRPVVEGLLRRRIGYRGLVLTDDLEMGAVDQAMDGAAQAIAALLAGSDGLMFCRDEGRILQAHAGLLRALEDGVLPAPRLSASLRRILALKQRVLVRRRRSRYSVGSMARSRLLLESLGLAEAGGVDPTARL